MRATLAKRYIHPAMLSCPEMKGLDSDGCLKCGGPIPKRRRSWCDEHASWFAHNHYWTGARFWALQMASIYDIERTRCDRWHMDCKDESHLHRNRGAICAFCGGLGQEVDHIEAANGAHKEYSCLHHQENLRVLCIPCHRARTREQATERARERRLAQGKGIAMPLFDAEGAR